MQSADRTTLHAAPHPKPPAFLPRWLWWLLGAVFATFTVLLLIEYGTPDVGRLMQWLLDRVLEEGYAAIFAVAVLGAFGLPIPAGAVFMASAFYATQGRFAMPMVVLAATAGTILGDNAGFWIARLYGAALLDAVGLRAARDRAAVVALERQVQEHPAAAAFLTRFITTFTPIANLVIGLSAMRATTFLAYGALGQVIEVALNCALGALFGNQWQTLYKIFGRTGMTVLLLALLAFVATHRRLFRRWRRPRAGAVASPPPESHRE